LYCNNASQQYPPRQALLRIEVPGGMSHVTPRGDRREAICLDDTDRQKWLDLTQPGAGGGN
jgi:hypothetical protein